MWDPQFIRTKLREDKIRLTTFATTVEAAVTELQQKAASQEQVSGLHAETAQLRTQPQDQQVLISALQGATTPGAARDQAARTAVDALQQELNSAYHDFATQQQQLAAHLAAQQQAMTAGTSVPGATPQAGSDALNLRAFTKTITETRTPTPPEDSTVDIRTWGVLRDRFGLWDAARNHLHEALHLIPGAFEPQRLETAFEAFADLFGIVSRWDSIEALSAPADMGVVEAINGVLRRLIIAAKQQRGLHLKSDANALNATADPMKLALQRSLETTYKSTFITRQGMPPPPPAQPRPLSPRRRRPVAEKRHRQRDCPVNDGAARARGAAGRLIAQRQSTTRRQRRARARRDCVREQHVEQHRMDANAKSVGPSTTYSATNTDRAATR
jgi:hypothetical protein